MVVVLPYTMQSLYNACLGSIGMVCVIKVLVYYSVTPIERASHF